MGLSNSQQIRQQRWTWTWTFGQEGKLAVARNGPVGAGPVAQSVERWTPYGGSICPGYKSSGFEARRAPDVYRASWRVWLRLVAGRSQSKSAIGAGRARLCAYVKLSTLNSAIDPELRDRKVGGSVLVNPSNQRIRTKFIKIKINGCLHQLRVQNKTSEKYIFENDGNN